MGRYDRKHSAVAKAAVVHAVEVLNLTSAQISALAAAGELKTSNGRRIGAFEIAESTVRHYATCARRRQRRNGHEDDEHQVALAVRDAAQPAEESAPDPEPSPLLQRLAAEMDEERKATEDEIAKRPGEQCRCEELERGASNLLTAVDPRGWALHNGAPTCGTCRLPITDWRTRFATKPVLLKELEAWRRRSRSPAG